MRKSIYFIITLLYYYIIFFRYLYKEINAIELDAFIGIAYLRALNNDNSASTTDLWHLNDPFRSQIYNSIMSRNRYSLIKKFLRFDDCKSRAERRKSDKLAPITDFCKIIKPNFLSQFLILSTELVESNRPEDHR